MNPYEKFIVKKKTETSGTKLAIQRALLKIYRRKDVYEIMVKELCEVVPIARTTFYSHYQNIAAVMADIEDCLVADMLEITKGLREKENIDMDSVDIFKGLNSYILNEHVEEFYLLVVKHQNGSFIKKWKNAIKYNHYERYFKNNKINYLEELALEVMASAAIGAFGYGLDSPDKISISKLNDFLFVWVMMYFVSVEK